MAACTFFGHRDCPAAVKPKLRAELVELIERYGVERFYVGRQGAFDPVFSRFVQVMRLNQGMDFQHCLASKAEQMMPESLAQCVRTEELKRGDRAFAENIFFLTMAILAFAIMETLRDPEQRDGQRRLLEDRVEIVRAGGTARRNAAGEAPEQCFKGGDPC